MSVLLNKKAEIQGQNQNLEKSLLYVEMGEWHFDLFSSLFALLSPHASLSLFLNKSLQDKIPQGYTQGLKKNFFDLKKMGGRVLALLNYLWLVWFEHYDIVFFNTAHGGLVRWMTLLSPPWVILTGIHHNAQKLQNSTSQKVISFKLKKYIVLADFISESLAGKIDPSLRLFPLYPIYFEGAPSVKAISNKELDRAQEQNLKQEQNPAKDSDREKNKSYELRIAIPGVVETSRRDYFGLVDRLKKFPPQYPVKFLILGNSLKGDGPQLKKYVEQNEVQNYFQFWDGFVPNSTMQEQLFKCDLVMPLIMPGDDYFEMYFETKISGSYSLAFGYQKPLLMHEAFLKHKSLMSFCIFFDEQLDVILDRRDYLSEQIKEVVHKIQTDPRFQFKQQSDALFAFITGRR